MSSTTNLFLKVNEKSDKINLKFALNMYVPKPTPNILAQKQNDPIKTLKFGTTTPKPRPVKRSVKENGYATAFVSNNNSYISTPFECETIEIRDKNRNDYKFLYQVGSGGFGRVWKVQ